MKTLVKWCALAVGVAMLAGCVDTLTAEELDWLTVDPEDYAEGTSGVVTSPDGTITISLPASWYDHSAAYMADVPNSALSAMWGTKPTSVPNQGTFATVSTVPIVADHITVQDLEDEFSAAQRSSFSGELTEEHGEFTTSTDGQAAWTRFVGTFGDHEATLIAVVILQDHRAARFLIEAEPGGEHQADALFWALRSVRLAPFNPETDGEGHFVDGAYIQDTAISVTPAAEWMPFPSAPTVRDLALEREAAYAGLWFIPNETGTGQVLAMIMIAERQPGAQTPEELAGDAGEVGDVIVDPVTGSLKVTSIDRVVLENGIEGTRVCTSSLAANLPSDYGVCTYVLVQGEWWITAALEGVGIGESETQSLEGVLAGAELAPPS